MPFKFRVSAQIHFRTSRQWNEMSANWPSTCYFHPILHCELRSYSCLTSGVWVHCLPCVYSVQTNALFSWAVEKPTWRSCIVWNPGGIFSDCSQKFDSIFSDGYCLRYYLYPSKYPAVCSSLSWANFGLCRVGFLSQIMVSLCWKLHDPYQHYVLCHFEQSYEV